MEVFFMSHVFTLFLVWLIHVVTVAQEPGYCTEDWIPFEDYLYYAHTVKKVTFDEASNICQSLGGDLTSIHNSKEQKFHEEQFVDQIGADLWIGLHDIINEGHFEWIDGSVLNYTYWGSDQPDDWQYIGGEDCVHLRTSGRWNDQPCFNSLYFICKKLNVQDVLTKAVSPPGSIITSLEPDDVLAKAVSPTLGSPSGSKSLDREVPGLEPNAAINMIIGTTVPSFIAVLLGVAFVFYLLKFRQKHHSGQTAQQQQDTHNDLDDATYAEVKDLIKIASNTTPTSDSKSTVTTSFITGCNNVEEKKYLDPRPTSENKEQRGDQTENVYTSISLTSDNNEAEALGPCSFLKQKHQFDQTAQQPQATPELEPAYATPIDSDPDSTGDTYAEVNDLNDYESTVPTSFITGGNNGGEQEICHTYLEPSPTSESTKQRGDETEDVNTSTSLTGGNNVAPSDDNGDLQEIHHTYLDQNVPSEDDGDLQDICHTYLDLNVVLSDDDGDLKESCPTYLELIP
ncbi:uncharacterized protein [Amphiura filiformis]|uniref:uncharacterized protein isoform X2 n=1 Tax=Amphiura filiformis TaxID=82378 RepID=UPI003B210BFF